MGYVPRNLFSSKRVRGRTNFNPKQIYSYKQIVSGQGLTQASTTLSTYNSRAAYMQQTSSETSWAFSFCLNDLDQQSTFASLYDQYRIDKVQVRLRPAIKVVQHVDTNTTAANPYVPGVCISAVDLDDASVGAMSVLRQYHTAKQHSVTNGGMIVRTFRPRVAEAVWRTIATTAYGPGKAGKWIDVSYTDVPHYGFKFAADAAMTGVPAASSPQVWEIDCIYWVSFKNVR